MYGDKTMKIIELLVTVDESRNNPVNDLDFKKCAQIFVDERELRNLACHTRRWHRENLHYVKETLLRLDLPTRPIDIADYNAPNG